MIIDQNFDKKWYFCGRAVKEVVSKSLHSIIAVIIRWASNAPSKILDEYYVPQGIEKEDLEHIVGHVVAIIWSLPLKTNSLLKELHIKSVYNSVKFRGMIIVESYR